MNLEISRENLVKALGISNLAIQLRPNLPVLANTLLEARKGFLELSSTDLEKTIVYKTGAKVVEEGKVTAPARLLLDFSQSITGTSLNLKLEKENLLVESGTTKASMATIDAGEFPQIKEFEPKEEFEIAGNDLLKSLANVSFCAATEEGRPILTGVLLRSQGSNLEAVATDGYRLGASKASAKGQLPSIVVPAKSMLESAKAFANEEDETISLAVNAEGSQARLRSKNLSITTRSLEGSYPNYEAILPNSFLSEATLDRKELIEAIKLVALFSRDIGNVVRLETDKKSLQLKANTAQVGEADTQLSAKSEGENLATAFNSRFLLEALNGLSGKSVTLSFSGVTSAARIQDEGEKDLFYIVMPVKMQG
jgi:DNA polymerase-3 subunit beta